MSNRRSKETAPDRGPRLVRLIGLLVCGAAFAGGACASATVNPDPPKQDAAAGGAGGGAGGSGGSGGQGGKKDGGNRDVSFGSCNPFTNEGCSGDEKCAALQSGGELGLGCGSKKDKGENESCTQVVENGAQTGDDCGEGLSCFGAPAACHRPCTDTHCCPANEICGGAAPGLPTLGWCQAVTTCKPLEQEGCADGQACYFTSSTCYTGSLCAKAGAKKPGEACMLSNECQPGSNCLIVGSSGTCSAFCSTADDGSPKCDGDATGGDICDPVAGGESAEENLGSCRKPTR